MPQQYPPDDDTEPDRSADDLLFFPKSAGPTENERETRSAPAAAMPPMAPSDKPSPAPESGPVPPRQSARSGHAWRWPAIIIAGVFALLLAAYVVDLMVSGGRIAGGTRIGGVDVGGRTPDEAVAILQESLDVTSAPLAVTAHGVELGLDPASAGLTLDVQGSVAAAGTRSANPIARIGVWFGGGKDLPVIAAVDETQLTGALQVLAAASDVAPVEGSVQLVGTEVRVAEPVIGRYIVLDAAVEAVRDAWLSGDPGSVDGLELPVTEQPVRASAAGVATAAAEARTLLSGPLTVMTGETTFTVPLETIAAAVTIDPDGADGFLVAVDEAAIAGTMAEQLAASQTAPVDASIAIVGGVPVVSPGVDGKTVDTAATATALTAALRVPDHVLTVAYALTPPDLTTEEAQALGIVEEVSSFTTGGFAADSGQNVKQVAEEVQGAIVLPGETFSLNGYTGPRTAAEGYVEAGIISDGVPGRAVGGGISQFATTLYNASYFAGMRDVEHRNHSYYISRYPAGREATVFQNPDGSSVIDVKFENTGTTAILIETVWTPSDITVRFWGTKTVEVESFAGDRYAFTDPPTKTIPYGETCRATNGSSGFSIDVTRVISDLAGTEISRETITTVYNGQVRVICAPAPQPAQPAEPGG